MVQIQQLKEKLARACRIVYRETPLPDPFGHISLRISENKILILGHVHDEGRSLEDALPEDIVQIDLDGNILEGKSHPPEEKVIHTAIYRARKDVNSVVHAHPQIATAFSTVDQKILPITLGSTIFYKGVPIVDVGTSWITSEAHGKVLVEKLGDRNAVLLRGHGVVTAGRTLEEACFVTIALEKAAKMQIIASMAGTPKPFSAYHSKEYAQVELPDVHEWTYFEKRLRQLEQKSE